MIETDRCILRCFEEKDLELLMNKCAKKCQTKNPLGKCCHQIIKEAIDEGLSMNRNAY